MEPDNELVRRAVAGDTEAFTTLCDSHRARVWRIAASVGHAADADDLAQEAIIRAYCALATYRADAPFGAWLCRIALNVAHDYQRSAWRRRIVLWPRTALPDGGGPAVEAPAAAAERRELQRRVRQAVAALPASQRVPLWLSYFEGFTLAELALLEGVPESTLRSRVRAGLRKLERALADLLEDPGEAASPVDRGEAAERRCRT
uniref:RNA polymerase sigma factor n=1 Tax=uncultured Armatimonadetes bacterium TaxID=157466 RepID=A0A6J4H4Z2_9BACT|nr:hypothetical protein AVDCRST_MAG63-367 [uncultured Armatimonadetes bacterium]